MSGERTAGFALSAELRFADGPGVRCRRVRAGRGGRRCACCCRGPDGWLLVDTSGRRRHGRAVGGHGLLPAAGPGDARRCACRRRCRRPRQRVEDLAATVLAAEAAGLARWALQTATEYAKVREQFGKPIGSFQAIKHMCAEMLLRSEQIAVAAADAAQAAAAGRRRPQLSIAAAVAAATGIEAAKANAKDCIQVLGGIGITWEHDAHLYLRRAYGISQILGGRSRWLRRVVALTRAGRAPRAATST